MASPCYSLTITALESPRASGAVARFLAQAFPDFSPQRIRASLGQLPLQITDRAPPLAAETLWRHLESRGATVLIDQVPEPEDVCLHPPAPRLAGSEDTLDEALLAEFFPWYQTPDTTYSYVRPGARKAS